MLMLRRLHGLIFAHKIGHDLVWTFGSFAILAVSGVLINIVIAVTRDASALGVFNIAYAVYIVGSQVAALGIHYSVLRHGSYYQEQPEENGRMLLTAIVLSILLGLTVGSGLFLLAPYTQYLFGSGEIAQAIRFAALGLTIFPLNKVLVSYTNSLRHMKAFAALQSLRYIAVMAVVSAVSISDIAFTYTTFSFLVAELLTTLCCLVYLGRVGLLQHLRFCRNWARRHLIFGTKGVMAGIFVDLNTRLDVLVLGTLLSPRDVGIYSFAAMLVDGLQHVLSIVRVNFNPMLVKALRDHDHTLASRMLRMSKRLVLPGTALLSLCLVIGFWVMVQWITPGKGLDAGLAALVILVTGFTFISPLAPFDNLLLVSGYPGYQTLQSAVVTVMNIGLCLFLVPSWGIEGAATATIAGYMTGLVFLCLLSPRLTGWHLLSNRFELRAPKL